MRIAIDAKRAFHNKRGLGNYSRDVIRLLTTFAPNNQYLLFAQPPYPYHFNNTTVISPKGFWKHFPSIWRMHGCINQLQDGDLFFGLSAEIPIGIHKRNIRTIVTIHDAIFIRYPELYSYTYRKLFTLKVQYACQHADTIIAISQQTKNDIIQFFNADENKIKVVYQGCNNIFRQPLSQPNIDNVRKKYNLPPHYLIIVGALEPRKNTKNLIKAINLTQIPIPLVAVGAKSKYASECNKLAKQLGVHFIVLQQTPLTDMPALYKGASIAVYPSIFEGFGLPILEAMCTGTPVLTSTGSCFNETAGKAAIYANPLEPQDIADKISHILSNTELQQQMIQEGLIQSQKFTDEKVANNLLNTILQ